MPEDTGRVLDNANIGGDIRLIVLDQRDALVFPCLTEETSKIVETGKAPVSLLGGESVSRN
jgi:hypothetical protein